MPARHGHAAPIADPLAEGEALASTALAPRPYRRVADERVLPVRRVLANLDAQARAKSFCTISALGVMRMASSAPTKTLGSEIPPFRVNMDCAIRGIKINVAGSVDLQIINSVWRRKVARNDLTGRVCLTGENSKLS